MQHSARHFTRRVVVPLALAVAALPAVGRAQSPDRVRLTDKTEVIGEIVTVSPGDVEIKDQRDGETKQVTIDRIAFVVFGGEPDALRTARDLFLRQDSAGALEELGKIEKVELDGASDNVLAEVAFVGAAAAGRQATVAGADLAGAEKGLREFLQKHPRSHHVFRAQELLGDLLVRAGKFDEAAAAYATMEKGPPALVVRAATAKAGSWYEQKNYAEAEKEYAAAERNGAAAEAKASSQLEDARRNREEAEKAKVIKDVTEWKQKEAGAQQERDAAARQKHEAQVGRARCLARQGRAADAVQVAQGVIREADPENRELLGRAFTALGDAFRAAGREQDAIIAFLTVDLVYNTLPESHAEALYNLVQLWQEARNPERSREARQSLETAYPESRWTKSLTAAAGKG